MSRCEGEGLAGSGDTFDDVDAGAALAEPADHRLLLDIERGADGERSGEMFVAARAGSCRLRPGDKVEEPRLGGEHLGGGPPVGEAVDAVLTDR